MRWLVFNVVCRFVEVLFDLSHLGLECVKVPLVVCLSFWSSVCKSSVVMFGFRSSASVSLCCSSSSSS